MDNETLLKLGNLIASGLTMSQAKKKLGIEVKEAKKDTVVIKKDDKKKK